MADTRNPTDAPPTAGPPDAGLTVGDVAREAGVATSAVRFYERYGVIQAERTSVNHRVFDQSAACRIKVAKLAQGVGLTVREIAELLADLSSDPQPEDWAGIACELMDEAERRVAALRSCLTEIASASKLCEGVDRMS
ncbi:MULTISPECIES: MerR family transcriptional regulator [Streptomyces]|uniref:Transcriptional regulator n=2 Tax=Streptomyces TaxID=1883 RepID=A0A100Y7E1_9ACTN|nr:MULTISPECIES: MerR family transcriptional regulator [Streptomyces]KUH39042.1 transcriptional regulator [Streptomyces kanasensis]UUS34611.1 MerR family transcriptional regulator [Streptomyces changanensis]